jgi:hypothetical protein
MRAGASGACGLSDDVPLIACFDGLPHQALLEHAGRCAPSIIVLEDLHLAFPAAGGGGPGGGSPEGAPLTPPMAELVAAALRAWSMPAQRPPVMVLMTALGPRPLMTSDDH